MDTKKTMFIMLALACAVLVIIIISLATQTADGPKSCPADYAEHPPLILVSLDGFRASYRDRGLTPTINRLADEGVSAPFMMPVFPTVTLPNHYTIVTGLYPESHGIVANSFHDPKYGNFVPDSKNTSWWGGVPIWNTVTQQGLKSATYLWVGSDSEIGGERPTYWIPYNYTIPFEDRVDQVLEWVKMEPEERPAWISVYFSEPDHTGHKDGPHSDSVKEQLERMDGIINRLVTGLEDEDLLDCVNLIIVSDHGMAGGGELWKIKLTNYIENPDDLSRTYTGPFTMISLKDESEDAKNATMQKLVCDRPDMRAFEKEGLPKRLHYSNNDRIEDIVIELNPGRITEITKSETYRNGNHGYDNFFTSMNALFVARGPGFKSGVVTQPFQNFQLYNVMCHLTGVPPEPNNGTLGALNDILMDPVPPQDIPEVDRPSVPAYPDKKEILNRLKVAKCPGDLTEVEDWLSVLENTLEEQEALEARHAPWGLPQLPTNGSRLQLLHQPDYVTGYSASRKTPLWASFTLEGAPGMGPLNDLVSDVRLDADSSPTCAEYDNVDNAITALLFYPGFSSSSSRPKIPYMVSNIILSTPQQQEHWTDLMARIIMGWLGDGSSLNLVVGPVFDLNFDSNADPFSSAESYPQRPSDLFAIVTRCGSDANIADCQPEDIDIRAFIYPTEVLADNCFEKDGYARKFSCTLQDVRAATGLAFFPGLDAAQRVRLETSIHQTLW